MTAAHKKTAGMVDSLRFEVLEYLLVAEVVALELAVEFLNTAGGVDELLLAGVEGVRSGRDVDFDEGVLVAIFPLNGFFAEHGGFGQE